MDRGVGVLQLSRLSETGTLGPPRQGAHPADGMHDLDGAEANKLN